MIFKTIFIIYLLENFFLKQDGEFRVSLACRIIDDKFNLSCIEKFFIYYFLDLLLFFLEVEIFEEINFASHIVDFQIFASFWIHESETHLKKARNLQVASLKDALPKNYNPSHPLAEFTDMVDTNNCNMT